MIPISKTRLKRLHFLNQDQICQATVSSIKMFIWVWSLSCSCLVTWFCYQMITKPGNKTAAPLWPNPYGSIFQFYILYDFMELFPLPTAGSLSSVRTSRSSRPVWNWNKISTNFKTSRDRVSWNDSMLQQRPHNPNLTRSSAHTVFNTLRLAQNGCHFPNNIFKCIFLNESCSILMKFPLQFVPMWPVNIIIYSSIGSDNGLTWSATSYYLNQW